MFAFSFFFARERFDLPVYRTDGVHVDGLFIGFERLDSRDLLEALSRLFLIHGRVKLDEINGTAAFSRHDLADWLDGGCQPFNGYGWFDLNVELSPLFEVPGRQA